MKTFRPLYAFLGLAGIILILFLFHLGSFLHLRIHELDQSNWFFQMFNFNKEKNIPALFSALLHFTASFLLIRITFRKIKIPHPKWFWGVLSFTFLFLGCDELFQIHESIRGNIFDDLPGKFLYTWSLLYASVFLIVGIIVTRPLFKLPKHIFWGFLASGSLFVLGAIGMENIAGHIILQQQVPPHQIDINPYLFFISSIEELLEKLGVSLFIFFILDFTRRYTTPTPSKKRN